MTEAPKPDDAPAPRGRGQGRIAPDSLAYIPHPGVKPVERRGAWILPALLAAGGAAAAAFYFHQTTVPSSGAPAAREIAAPSPEPAPLPKINAEVVDHYNPLIKAARRPDLESRKVQFNNGVYSVVPPNTQARPSDDR